MYNLYLHHPRKVTVKTMDNLLVIFLIQAILGILLFSLIYHLRKQNSEARKELDALKEAMEKRKIGT